MQSIRNKPCPCGSGKKHKRCCMPIVRHDAPMVEHPLIRRDVNRPKMDEAFAAIVAAALIGGRFD